jgi:hypothetical protein
MSRPETEFLQGFEKAALLARRVADEPPSYTSPPEYLKDVARLLVGSNSFVERGLAAGCLSAIGEM